MNLIQYHFNELDKLKSKWAELHAKSDASNPFTSFEWIKIWLGHFLNDENACQVQVILDDREEVVGIIPLVNIHEKHAGVTFKGLSFAANSHSFRTRLLVLPEKKQEIIKFWLEAVCQNQDFDYLRFKEFLYDETVVNILNDKKLKFSLEEPKKPPYLDLKGDWESYFGGLRGHFRRNLRRRLRNAEKEYGKIEYRVFDGSDEELDAFVLQGLKLEASGWKGKRGSAILKSQTVKDFYFDVAHNFFRRGLLHLGGLYFGERLVAFNFSVIYEQVFYLLKVAYDESVAKFSPGQIMTYLLLQRLFEQKLKRFDFLGPAMPWKLEWTGQFNQHSTLYIYGNTFKGSYLYTLNSKLLPALRKIEFLKKLKQKIIKQ
ncbi:GNAT family N-acetyltransferase [Caldithrix abyssi]